MKNQTNNTNAKVFLKVAETGSFKKAADELGYTQAGISYIINAMEQTWDMTLFTREYGGVKLTSEGRQLLPLIRQLHHSERDLAREIDEINNIESGTITIVSLESVLINWIPDIIQRFNEKYPRIEFNLLARETRDEAEALLYGSEADCGFFVMPAKKKLDVLPLYKEPMMAIVSPDHPLAKLDKFPVKEMESEPYISLSYDNDSEIVDLFNELGVSPKSKLTLTSDYAAILMVAENYGYSIFSKLVLDKVSLPVKCMELSTPVFRTIGIGVRSQNTCSKAVREFIKCAKEYVAEQYPEP
ncbi:MAG: LysR family transcriptional regulator [Bacillota bacterium]|nr:LysR family transcriptional regulator [Bacillota bacterium]